MTVKEFVEVATGRIYLNDFGKRLPTVPGSVLYDAIKDCVICEIDSIGGEFEITLEKRLVRKDG